jgi:hypothetical protein
MGLRFVSRHNRSKEDTCWTSLCSLRFGCDPIDYGCACALPNLRVALVLCDAVDGGDKADVVTVR